VQLLKDIKALINNQNILIMKNISSYLFVTLIALTSATAISQEVKDLDKCHKFYVRAGGGMVWETGKTEFNNADPNGITGIQQSTDVSTDGATVNVKSLNGTLGAGYKVNITGGYMFNRYVGAELGVNYFDGNKTRIGRLTSPAMLSDEKAYVRGFDLIPALYLTPGFKKWNPYARVGAIMTGPGKLKIETSATKINGGGPGTNIQVNALTEVKSKFSVGLAAAAGITYPISEKLNLFGEIEFKNFSVKSKSAEIVEYSTIAITNGHSQLVPGQQLADLPVSAKKFVFADNFSQSATTPAPSNEPRKIPSQFINTSGTGINIGVKYSF
jgi:opacity protein-like surface antigen